MGQDVYGWQTSDEHGNALSALYNGARSDFVPVAPLFVDSPFRGYADDRLCGSWEARIAAEGETSVAAELEMLVQLRFEVMCEIIDRYNSPPCWARFPWSPFKGEVEGCRISREGDRLVWVEADGRTAPLVERLRELDRRPGPWPMEQPVHRPLDEVERALREDPESLVPRGTLGDPGFHWESSSEEDLRASGCLSAWDRLKGRYGNAMPFYIVGSCPTQVLQDVMGVESLMVGFLQAPELVHEVSRLGMPKNRAHWQAVRDAGVDIVHVSEYSWGGQISPDIYGSFVAPYTRELLEFYRGLGFKVLLYVMGDIRPVVDQIAAQPFDALAIEEGRKGYDLEVGEIRRAIGDERLLYGNVERLLVEEGEPEDILAEVRRQIRTEGETGRFVVSIGEPLSQASQPERVRLFCDSTRLLASRAS